MPGATSTSCGCRICTDRPAVIAYGEEAVDRGFTPSDNIEWIPLRGAYVASGQTDALLPYVGMMKKPAFIYSQTCQVLASTALETRPDDQELREFIQTNFCPTQ